MTTFLALFRKIARCNSAASIGGGISPGGVKWLFEKLDFPEDLNRNRRSCGRCVHELIRGIWLHGICQVIIVHTGRSNLAGGVGGRE